jgi:protein-S-isoprenylcysteine O-methyltransferase Ste14
MWIKPVIVVLLVLLLISLGSGFVFLMKDQGRTRRTLHSLGIRVSLAAALVAVIAWGFYTGQLHSKAPWDAALEARRAQPASPPR